METQLTRSTQNLQFSLPGVSELGPELRTARLVQEFSELHDAFDLLLEMVFDWEEEAREHNTYWQAWRKAGSFLQQMTNQHPTLAPGTGERDFSSVDSLSEANS